MGDIHYEIFGLLLFNIKHSIPGTQNETVYEGGGEVAFISMMVQESIKYKHKIRHVYKTKLHMA